MKRVITYLIVLLIALPVIGQEIDERNQKIERFKKHIIIDAFKEGKKQKKNNHFDFIAKMKGIQKLTKAADKNELDSLISSQWDDNLNEWVRDSKEEFTYDVNENLNSFIYSEWYEGSLAWTPIMKYELNFDSNRNLLEFSNYFWWGGWFPNEKMEFNYDGNGNLTLDTTFAWDYMNNLWVQSYKTEYTYDGNQNLILVTNFEWFSNENKWYFQYKDELTYNMSNNLIQEITSWWNYGTSQWDPGNKWVYTYDVGNNLISEVLTSWDGNDWVNEDKYEYSYNTGGQLTVDIGFDWSISINYWNPFYKDEYTYDSNGNRTLGYYYEWISGNPGEWSNYYYDEFIFDLAYDMNDIIGPLLFEDLLGYGFGDIAVAFNNMVIGYRGYEYENQSWTDIDKVIFYYSDYNNALNIDDEILSQSVKLYPNPVDDVLIVYSEIPLTKVEVYSILGKKVKEFNAGFNSMRIDNLSNGVYIVRILAEKGSATRKLIKK
ncbi:MAG: T9SS type A sorting domain-containing protein [Flavobacteriaceae bacterium]|nr:T9SS type A sorting domain-containing protein [Flavobacteriaceae bacterium]